jgi:type IV secretion system protein VirB2
MISHPASLPASPSSSDLIRLRTRATQVVLIVVLLLISGATSHSGSVGGGMPWEGPLNQLLDSLTGPVSRVVGAVAIIGLGVGIAFSEGGSMMRKALWVVLGLAIAFNAVSWGLGFLGFSGGLLV